MEKTEKLKDCITCPRGHLSKIGDGKMNPSMKDVYCLANRNGGIRKGSVNTSVTEVFTPKECPLEK